MDKTEASVAAVALGVLSFLMLNNFMPSFIDLQLPLDSGFILSLVFSAVIAFSVYYSITRTGG